jgi:hypothetical protein
MLLVMLNRCVHIYPGSHVTIFISFESQATQLDPKYAKAWGRLATAGMVTMTPHQDTVNLFSNIHHIFLGTFCYGKLHQSVEDRFELSAS